MKAKPEEHCCQKIQGIYDKHIHIFNGIKDTAWQKQGYKQKDICPIWRQNQGFITQDIYDRKQNNSKNTNPYKEFPWLCYNAANIWNEYVH